MSSTGPAHSPGRWRELICALNLKPPAWKRVGFVPVLVATHARTGLASGGTDARDALRIRASGATGAATFVTLIDSKAITLPQTDRLKTSPIQLKTGPTREPTPLDFLQAYGHLFGITAPNIQLVFDKADMDALGYTHLMHQLTEASQCTSVRFWRIMPA